MPVGRDNWGLCRVALVQCALMPPYKVDPYLLRDRNWPVKFAGKLDRFCCGEYAEAILVRSATRSQWLYAEPLPNGSLISSKRCDDCLLSAFRWQAVQRYSAMWYVAGDEQSHANLKSASSSIWSPATAQSLWGSLVCYKFSGTDEL